MKIYILILLAVLLFITSMVIAPPSYAGPVKKLSRGITNFGTGWIELFIAMQQSYEEHRYIGGMLYGIPIGLTKGLIRTGAGLYETLTFFVPIPKGYEPILEPEFITDFQSPDLEDMHDY